VRIALAGPKTSRRGSPCVSVVVAGRPGGRVRANIAGLYTIIATCEARGLNPFAYLSDVLTRVQDHPAKRLHELLPAAWEPKPA